MGILTQAQSIQGLPIRRLIAVYHHRNAARSIAPPPGPFNKTMLIYWVIR